MLEILTPFSTFPQSSLSPVEPNQSDICRLVEGGCDDIRLDCRAFVDGEIR